MWITKKKESTNVKAGQLRLCSLSNRKKKVWKINETECYRLRGYQQAY